MADPSDGKAEQRVRKGVTRRLTRGLLVLLALTIILGWLSTGFYKLQLGEEAIILRLGEHQRNATREGWNWHWPEPLEYDKRVNTKKQRTHLFGRDGSDVPPTDQGIFIQTADKNIVSVSFELQYTIDDPYEFEYGMVQPDLILYEAAQSAVRKVIGGMTIDEVLIKRKQEVEVKAQILLEGTMRDYFSAGEKEQPFSIDKINLQEVNPPSSVLAAFAEVAAAQQDQERFVNQAKGERAEILEGARAESAELREGSEAYKEASILDAKGRAGRFSALRTEYELAPEVTRQRLYLETMEEILPDVDKLLVEPGAVQLIPIMRTLGATLPVLQPSAQTEVSTAAPAPARERKGK